MALFNHENEMNPDLLLKQKQEARTLQAKSLLLPLLKLLGDEKDVTAIQEQKLRAKFEGNRFLENVENAGTLKFLERYIVEILTNTEKRQELWFGLTEKTFELDIKNIPLPTVLSLFIERIYNNPQLAGANALLYADLPKKLEELMSGFSVENREFTFPVSPDLNLHITLLNAQPIKKLEKYQGEVQIELLPQDRNGHFQIEQGEQIGEVVKKLEEENLERLFCEQEKRGNGEDVIRLATLNEYQALRTMQFMPESYKMEFMEDKWMKEFVFQNAHFRIYLKKMGMFWHVDVELTEERKFAFDRLRRIGLAQAEKYVKDKIEESSCEHKYNFSQDIESQRWLSFAHKNSIHPEDFRRLLYEVLYAECSIPLTRWVKAQRGPLYLSEITTSADVRGRVWQAKLKEGEQAGYDIQVWQTRGK